MNAVIETLKINGLQTELPLGANIERIIELMKVDKKGNPRGNVNYVEIKEGVYNVRTYERGVEDETWACGTGATSVAIASHHLGILKENICHIKMPGGNLTIEFKKAKNGTYQNIWLTGPAVCVFEGEIK